MATHNATHQDRLSGSTPQQLAFGVTRDVPFALRGPTSGLEFIQTRQRALEGVLDAMPDLQLARVASVPDVSSPIAPGDLVLVSREAQADPNS